MDLKEGPQIKAQMAMIAVSSKLHGTRKISCCFHDKQLKHTNDSSYSAFTTRGMEQLASQRLLSTF